MSLSTAGARPFKAEMNLTPMIDVLLVLIIIFMVTVSAIQKKGLVAEIPQPASGPGPQVRTIVIQVGPQPDQQLPTLQINGKKVVWGELQDRLRNIFKQRRERVAFIQADSEVDYQYIADAISIARSSGIDRIGLLPGNKLPSY